MNSFKCPRCHDSFYTALPDPETKCPYCGYSLKQSINEKRASERSVAERLCSLSGMTGSVSANTIDISDTGVGISKEGDLPFSENEIVRVVVKEFDIDSDARLVWIKKFNSEMCRAGLELMNSGH